jgi:hypothetical protein
MMMSGSWRRNALNATGNVSPAFLVHVDLIHACQLDFGGILGRRDVDAGLVQDVEASVERHRLAAAGRPGDEDQPIRPPDGLQQRGLLIGLVAQRLDADLDPRRIENTHDDLFAEERRQRAHPEIDRLGLGQHDFHPAVLRDALFRDVELGDHLDPRGELVLDHERRLGDLHQDAVEAVSDPVVFFVRLEVDVRDAGLDGVDQDLLQITHDRRILDLGAFLVPTARLRGVGLLEIDLQVLHRAYVLQQRTGRLDQLVNRRCELVVFDDDRLDDEIRLETDLLQALDIGRVGGRHIETVAAFVQRQNVPRLGNLEVDELFRELIDVEA